MRPAIAARRATPTAPGLDIALIERVRAQAGEPSAAAPVFRVMRADAAGAADATLASAVQALQAA